MMGILPLEKCVNRGKCSFMTKQRMIGVFAIDEILRYRWTRFVGSRTLCHPVIKTKEYTALCSLYPPFFYYHRFCIFPTRLPAGSFLPVVWLVSRIYKNLDLSVNPNARLADSTKILPRGAYDHISTTKDRYFDVIQMHWEVLIKLAARRSWSHQWRGRS